MNRDRGEDANRESSPWVTHRPGFVSGLGHEIRTPLGSVLMLAEMLAANTPGNLDAKQLDKLEKIHRAASEMRALLDETSILAKIEDGRVDVHPRDLTISDLVAEIEAAHPDVAETGFRVEVEGAAPASFHVDRVHLAEIFRNLFEVATRAPRARVRRDGDTLQISLTDSGPALTEVDRAAVFAAFSAADPRLRRPSGGKSLRLTIARARARLLGGELSLENEADSGSCFVLRLPLRA